MIGSKCAWESSAVSEAWKRLCDLCAYFSVRMAGCDGRGGTYRVERRGLRASSLGLRKLELARGVAGRDVRRGGAALSLRSLAPRGLLALGSRLRSLVTSARGAQTDDGR